MYLTIKQIHQFTRNILFSICFLGINPVAFTQESDRYDLDLKNSPNLETGILFASSEAEYYGAYFKFAYPLQHTKHYFSIGASFTSYFDFSGESEPMAELVNDVDMRLIPAFYPAYNFHFKNFSYSIEMPIGTSIAITKGKLINEKIGFEQTYSNTELFLHFGLGATAKYVLNRKHSIGIYGFYPLVKDAAWTLPSIGIGWTYLFSKKN